MVFTMECVVTERDYLAFSIWASPTPGTQQDLPIEIALKRKGSSDNCIFTLHTVGLTVWAFRIYPHSFISYGFSTFAWSHDPGRKSRSHDWGTSRYISRRLWSSYCCLIRTVNSPIWPSDPFSISSCFSDFPLNAIHWIGQFFSDHYLIILLSYWNSELA